MGKSPVHSHSPLSGEITTVMLIVIALTSFTPVFSEPACGGPGGVGGRLVVVLLQRR